MTNYEFKLRTRRDMFYDLISQASKSLSIAQKLTLVMDVGDPKTKEHGRIIGDIKSVLYHLHGEWAYTKKKNDQKDNWLLDAIKKRDRDTEKADDPDFILGPDHHDGVDF